jgi:hypothetical protein
VLAALVVIAIAATTAGGFAVMRAMRGPAASRAAVPAPSDDEEAAAAAAPSGSAPAPAAEDGEPRVRTTAASYAADASANVDHVAALRRGLASNEEATRIAAVEAAVSATAIETLDELQRFQLARDPETAPTVIHAVALLGASADGKKRDEAAGTLGRWLRDEMKREGPDVPGNISNIVEALGDVGGRDAVDALGAALDRADLPLHVEALAVTKLGELGDARARGPVERFAKRVAALPPADGIDEELRVEAIAAARTTLSKP